jgi:anti-sigma regulatory factor (Ser/Thr protein kinase)
LTLDVDMRNVALARRFVESTFNGVIPSWVMSDLVLATSELVTNAIEHGRASEVVVTAMTDEANAWISVRSAHDAGGIGPIDRWETAAPDRSSGRGLGIVQAVADDVTVVRRDDSVEIIVSKRLDARRP